MPSNMKWHYWLVLTPFSFFSAAEAILFEENYLLHYCDAAAMFLYASHTVWVPLPTKTKTETTYRGAYFFHRDYRRMRLSISNLTSRLLFSSYEHYSSHTRPAAMWRPPPRSSSSSCCIMASFHAPDAFLETVYVPYIRKNASYARRLEKREDEEDVLG